jgi:two-component system, sensor histidine kinase LadS
VRCCALTAWLLSLAALISTEGWASPGGAAASVSAPAAANFQVSVLAGDSQATVPASAAEVTHGSLDARFTSFAGYTATTSPETLWLRLRAPFAFDPKGIPVLIARGGWFEHIEAFGAAKDPGIQELPHATDLREFGGAHHSVFILPNGLAAGQSLYLRVATREDGADSLRFSLDTLDATLARAAAHSRMIALAVGALMAMALGSLLIWFILADRLFILYTAMFSLEAVYLVFFSGEGFDWPVLSYTRTIGAYMWNVPVALGGAVASLFIREIADLKHSSPRTYRIFGWLAWVFVALTFSNLAHLIGLDDIVAAVGNLVFVVAAVFTLVVACIAWWRGNRAAGWFLIAWGMLETCAIVTAVKLLIGTAEHSEQLLYYWLPLSTVAAAILVALGVADRLRDQRAALTDAERRAQTDPLTGVLNRRSLIERLDAACLRARARGLPIALLFIDLDHFKEINDSYGHAAGDACLSAIIDPIQTELRQSDVIGRYGGEEFVVILSSADITAAHPIAERIRHRVAEVRIEGFGAPIGLTCSIGVATSDTLGVWGEHLIAQADAAVYAAKRSGRNRVQIAIAEAA